MFRKLAAAILVRTATLAFGTGAALAQSSTTIQKGETRNGVTREDSRVGRVFSDLERRVIREVLTETGVIDRESDDADDKEDDDDRRGAHAGKGSHADKGKGKGKDGLPPGLAKRDRQPPGLERQLSERGRLPPGLQKRALPEDLEARLP
jgi:hypothetical protein